MARPEKTLEVFRCPQPGGRADDVSTMPQRGHGSYDRTDERRAARLHLCRACARKAGLAPPDSPPDLALDAVVQSLIVANVGELVGELAEMACPDCGLKYMEFRAGGRLGCPRDYSVFSKGLAPCFSVFTAPPGTSARLPGVAKAHGAARNANSAPRGDRAGRIRRSRPAARLAPPQGSPRMTLEDLTKSSGEWLRGTGPESDIVMCSRIRLARNLADFPFSNRASRGEKAEIEAHFSSAMAHAKLELSYIDVNTLPNLDRQFLVERQIISPRTGQ